MKLITFGINEEKKLIVQIPIFVQQYIQYQFILYLIETIPVPILDLNKKANTYTIYK